MRRPVDSLMRRRGLVLVFCAMLVMSVFPAATFAHPPAGGDLSVPPTGDPERNPYLQPGRDPLDEGDDEDEELLKANDAVITRRTAGDVHLSVGQAGEARSAAHDASKHLTPVAPISPTTFNSPWTEISPNPIVQVTRGSSSFYAVAGRVSALAIRPSNGLKILGAAQGGIWTYDEATGVWVPRTDDQSTLSIGSIAIAPSNDNIVYAGTGEGNLSGDSYFGNGFLKSTDGGIHWAPIGGKTFHGVSIAKVVVDVNDANHVYAAVIRGRAGSRRTTPIDVSKYGLWESKNGGKTWKNIKKVTDELHGATDLVQDPGNPNTLYASFWADGIYRSTDGGKHWNRFMTGVPADATFGTGGGTRFALGISHPAGHDAVLYAGFEWTINGVNQPVADLEVRQRRGLEPAAGRHAGRRRQHLRLLRHAVLLRQRDRGRPERREHGLRARPVQLQHRVRRHLPLDRRRPDLEEPRLGPASRLPLDRHRPGRHLAGDDRQ